MGIYGSAALAASQLYIAGRARSPKEAWPVAIAQFSSSDESRKKGCPMDAYLGLCEAGLVRGIPRGNYGAPRNNRNGRYAIEAHPSLKSTPELAGKKTVLWNSIPEPKARNENGQLDVVLSLYRRAMLEEIIPATSGPPA